MAECKFIKGGAPFHGKQGLDYFAGISEESVGAKGICMHMLVMPPGATAKAHHHEDHETAIYVLEGESELRHGPNLEFCDPVVAGDYVFIPAGVPHQPHNSGTTRVVSIIARTDPNEQESVVLFEPLS